MKYCILTGNPIDGMGVIGPFDTVDDAQNFVQNRLTDSTWWIVTMGDPSSV
jgi:hypothetical protein